MHLNKISTRLKLRKLPNQADLLSKNPLNDTNFVKIRTKKKITRSLERETNPKEGKRNIRKEKTKNPIGIYPLQCLVKTYLCTHDVIMIITYMVYLIFSHFLIHVLKKLSIFLKTNKLVISPLKTKSINITSHHSSCS